MFDLPVCAPSAGWILVLVIEGIVCIAIGSIAAHMTGSMMGGGEKVVSAVDLVNQIMRSWAEYTDAQAIGGVLVGVEFNNANPISLRPQDATVVQKIGSKESRYQILAQRTIVTPAAGRWKTREAFTFELVD